MWTALSRQDLDAMLASALAEYGDDVLAWWSAIRIEPEKWHCPPQGDEGGGFWVVALKDGQALWFNDIEDGFNWSPYTTIGQRVPEGEVPTELTGPGTIVARQTTYWELVAEAGARYRVHFRDKDEASFAGAAYPSIEITAHHPLLMQYDAPLRTLFFSGKPRRPRVATDRIEQEIRDSSAAWRILWRLPRQKRSS